MHTTTTTESTYTAWQLLSRQYLTDASAFRSSSRVVRLKESLILMAGLCGRVCRSLHLWVTSQLEEWPERMQTHLAQPWDCNSYNHAIIKIARAQPSPWLCKINNEFHTGRYLFTVDYAESDVSEDPSQHKQSHVLVLTDAGKWTGNVVALPNNRVRVTSPAYWLTGEGAPDFRPSQWIQCAEQDDSYMDPEVTFNNLYKE
jgi:hypothetical protein